jgi:hypothetical protein
MGTGFPQLRTVKNAGNILAKRVCPGICFRLRSGLRLKCHGVVYCCARMPTAVLPTVLSVNEMTLAYTS